MTQRLNYSQQSPTLYKKYLDFSQTVQKDGIDAHLRDLIQIRASQINGCAFCVDMHVKEAKIHGERELRLHHVAIWRESPLFSARERAALAWTEALTRLGEDGIGDGLYAEARAHFNEKELTDLTFAVVTINGWNRLSIAFRAEPGSLDKVLGLDAAGLS
jgi:AhpD family alkylhydroperoxidase